jgi:hypothetical protein
MKRKKERRNTSSPMSWAGPHYQDYKLEEVDNQTINQTNMESRSK